MSSRVAGFSKLLLPVEETEKRGMTEKEREITVTDGLRSKLSPEGLCFSMVDAYFMLAICLHL